ncbi:hypothetical protein QAD02_010661 [Eretmocerus hayati]|uniref:Uncharacterized protein n=1 Tax=Eretmocerus hayati TaxID=131215 RepID=A0ACC2NUE5_9HYME|nr:hypothetical protein QAD02_010661 [Eretmocerus hayati]
MTSLAFSLAFSNERPSETVQKQYIDLMQAIRTGNEGLVQNLVNNGVPVNQLIDFPHLTPLHLAVQSRSKGIIKILLSKGADVNVKSWSGDTPLTLAAKTGNGSLIDILLSHNVCNCEDAHHFSHLHIASMRNRVDVVKKLLLIDQGEHLNSKVLPSSIIWQGYTPLHLAVHFDCIETIEHLLRCGASILAVNSGGLTPLHLADFQRNARVINILLSAHKNEFQNPGSPLGLTHFHIACTINNKSFVEHFLKLGVSVDLVVNLFQTRWGGWTPINFAVYYECPSVIEVLLKHGANLRVENLSRLLKYEFMMTNTIVYTPFTSRVNERFEDMFDFSFYTQNRLFHEACVENDANTIGKLLTNPVVKASCGLIKPNWIGRSPLHLAVKYNSGEVLKCLLDLGIDIIVRDTEGKTPLHLAFYIKSNELLQMMLERLDDTKNVNDNNGLSLFHIACTTGKLKLVQSFLHSGVDVNAKVWNRSELWAGFTPLHFACKYFQTEVVKILLDHRANLSIENGMHLNPFDFTVEKMITGSSFCHKKCYAILETILENSPLENKEFNFRGISILLGLNLKYDEREYSVKELNKIIQIHRDKLNSRIVLPRKHMYSESTPLHIASFFRNVGLAKLMIDWGADPLIVNGEGKTPLEYLCGYQHYCGKLLSKWATTFFTLETVNQPSRPSHFHMACAIGRSNLVRCVLEVYSCEKVKKIFVNCLDDYGLTPLHAVLERKNTKPKSRQQITRLLLENGADANARDFEMNTPLHFAYRYGDVDVVKQLINHGADVNVRNLYGDIPLVKFCKNNSAEQISLLLENGADINLMDRTGNTCLSAMAGYTPRYVDIQNRNKTPYCIIAMLKHVKKLQIVGWYISEQNIRAYAKSVDMIKQLYNEAAFITECEREIESMTTVQIDHYTTLRDIVMKNVSGMASHCQNIDLQRMVESDDFHKKFPLYGNIVKLQLIRGTARRSLLLKSRESLITLIGLHLPHSCVEIILQNSVVVNSAIQGQLSRDEDMASALSSSQICFQLVVALVCM